MDRIIAAGEMESIVSNALNTGSEALVELRFQKNPHQTQKYLEAEPKALGVTQIMLGFFILSITFSSRITNVDATDIINIIYSTATMIAGSVAIAAQNLHLPRLKACLGMQVVACVLAVISFFNSLVSTEGYIFSTCWAENHNDTTISEMCDTLLIIYEQITYIEMLVQMTQIALSATLAAFCCKVIQCCSPRNNVPVIVVNAPPAPQ